MAVVQTKMSGSILAKGFVLPTTGVVTGVGGFNVNDKIVIDKNLTTKEEGYIKNIFQDKILLNDPLKYSHDYHSSIENRFQGLNEFSEFVNPNASSVDIPKIRKASLSNVDANNGSIVINGTEPANRTLVHQTDSGSSS